MSTSGLFELDGNALDDAAVPGDDWETLYLGGGSALAVVSPMPISDSGLQSGTALLDAIFKGSSDVNDISTWGWVIVDANKPGALPPKDNTTNAYAAAYLQNGELLIYFGQDRLTANGTSDIGFWFLRRELSLVPDLPSCPPTQEGCAGTFSGQHTVGDVLVLSAFTSGGSVDTIEVYEWVGSGGNAGGGALQLIFHGTNADCGSASASPTACAIVNSQDEISPWKYQAGETGSVPNVFPPNHFFEGGVNLTALGIQGCFSTFLSETRSSSSLTAQLKDFAFGDFNVCSVAVNKTGPSLSKAGDSVTYSYEITNTGAAPLNLRSIVDDKIGNLATQAQAAGCGTLATGASCSFTVPFTIPAGAADPYVNTVTIEYIDAAAPNPATAVGFTATDSHSINLFQPSIAVSKTGPAFSKVGDTAQYDITLSNTSSADAPPMNCTVSDPIAGISQQVTLAFEQVVPIHGSHLVTAGDPDPLVNTVTATCSPTGFPNVLTQSASWTTDLLHPAWTFTKTCLNSPVPAGSSAQFRITLTNTGDADLLFQVSDSSILGLNFQGTLAVGQTVTKDGAMPVPSGATTVSNTASVDIALAPVYGLANEYTDSAAATCNVQQVFEGCTPGSWKNPNGRLQLWDSPTDPLAIAAGFYSGTSFNAYFGLTPAQSGFPDSLTMLQAINLGGGGAKKLARHAVAALLSVAAGLNYMYPPGTNSLETLREAIRNAYLTKTYEPLATQLANANEQICPI